MTQLLHVDVTIDEDGDIFAPGQYKIGTLDDAVSIDIKEVVLNAYLYDTIKRSEIENLIAEYILEEWVEEETFEYATAHAQQIFQMIEAVRVRTDD